MNASYSVYEYLPEIFITFVVLLWILHFKRRYLNLPPGPNGVPIIGFIPFINDQTIHHDLMLMSDQYKSKIIHLRLGFDDVIVINDLEIIKDVLSRNDMQDRPEHFIGRLFNTHDGQLVSWNGTLWRNQRNFSTRTLKSLGYGQTLEEKLHEELKYLTDKIDEVGNNPIHILSLLGPSVSNTMGTLTMGIRYDFDNEIRKNLDATFLGDQRSVGFTFFSYTCYFPEIMELIFKIPMQYSLKAKFFFQYVHDYLGDVINDKKKMIDQMTDHELFEANDNFSDIYLKKVRSVESGRIGKDGNEFFTAENLRGCLQGVYHAGSQTLKDMMEWFLVLVAVHQDAQEVMYQEIIRVLGPSRLVSQTDKTELPITESLIHETFRYASMIPINLPHVTLKDTKIGEYDILKGTQIMANIYAVHMDPSHFEEPEIFKYDRFLSADRSKFIKDDHLIPFGYGKRACPGESIAMLEIFIYAVTLIQKFHVYGDNDLEIKPRINGIARVAHRKLELKFKTRY